VPSYAGLADGRGVDEGCQFLQMLAHGSHVMYCGLHLDVLGQQSVEQVWVCGLEVDEVLELFDRSRLHSKESETCHSMSRLSRCWCEVWRY
jgi:hypothetical protein